MDAKSQATYQHVKQFDPLAVASEPSATASTATTAPSATTATSITASAFTAATATTAESASGKSTVELNGKLTSVFWRKVALLRGLLKDFWGLYVYGDEEKSTVVLRFLLPVKYESDESCRQIRTAAEHAARDDMRLSLGALGLSVSSSDYAIWKDLRVQLEYQCIPEKTAVACAGHLETHPTKGYLVGTDMADQLGY